MTVREFDKRFMQCYPMLASYANRYVQNDIKEAKDIVHNLYIRAKQKLHLYKQMPSGDYFTGWLLTILRNMSLNDYKKETKNPIVYYTELFENIPIQEKEYDRARKVKKAVQKLDNLRKRILNMYYLGYEYQEIAEKLDIPINTVKTKIHRARLKVIKKIEIEEQIEQTIEEFIKCTC